MHLQEQSLLFADPPLRGEDVKLLQSELAQLQLDIPPGEVQAASFGPGTRAAVMKFQRAHGLTNRVTR
jgi:peptidoglycan hydrolase-like protein with peptidoglycan-binding domain